MPIPTDTYWNIKRLNWVFAVSAIVLFAVTGWSIFQDHEKSWRFNQQQGRVWEAAASAPPGSVLAEILTQLREAREFYRPSTLW